MKSLATSPQIFVAVLGNRPPKWYRTPKGAENNVLLANRPEMGRNGCAPVAKALRDEDPCDAGSDSSQQRVVLILDHAERTVLKGQKPCRNHRMMVKARMTVLNARR